MGLGGCPHPPRDLQPLRVAAVHGCSSLHLPSPLVMLQALGLIGLCWGCWHGGLGLVVLNVPSSQALNVMKSNNSSLEECFFTIKE